GNTRAANMVVLGAYVGYTGVVDVETVLRTLPKVIKRKNLVPLNEKAVKKGVEFAKNFKASKEN
ncbi:MAG TPA: hypothetical protein ENK07_09740, partial [Bacteroidetes bacterium]|nr:hypothetical protein [Bacteroidota bacterium]